MVFVLTFWRPKVFRLTLYNFVYQGVCLIKKKIDKLFCFHSQKRITPIDSDQQSNKNEAFMTFVGPIHPRKSDVSIV